MPSTPLILSDNPNDYAAFSDESHSDGTNRYMVIGGILLRSAEAHKFSNAISETYAPFRFPDAIQWKNITKAKLRAYKAVIDTVAEHVDRRAVDFGCIIFDKTKIDHRKHNANDPEKGFFKFVYQHHLKWCRHYKSHSKFRCYHGNMDTRYNLEEMLLCLNRSVSQNIALQRPYLRFGFINAKNTRCVQIADLLIGAVGFAANGGPSKKDGTPKREIYDYMRDAFACHDFSLDTKHPDYGFHIWNFRL